MDSIESNGVVHVIHRLLQSSSITSDDLSLSAINNIQQNRQDKPPSKCHQIINNHIIILYHYMVINSDEIVHRIPRKHGHEKGGGGGGGGGGGEGADP